METIPDDLQFQENLIKQYGFDKFPEFQDIHKLHEDTKTKFNKIKQRLKYQSLNLIFRSDLPLKDW